MTNQSEMASEQGPRLAAMRRLGETLKADELANTVVSIIDSMVLVRKDGSTSYKWVIAHEDGTLGLYWAPGQAPPHQVQKWFRDYPGRALTVYLRREDGERGYPRWSIEQRGDDGEVLESDMSAPARAAAAAAAGPIRDQVPF